MPTLLFVPHYIGSLKYFEKLIPELKKYNVIFLFTPKVKEYYLSEMVNYCKKRNYQFYIIPRYSINKTLMKIPFYYEIAKAYNFQKKVRVLLKDKSIKKIISAFDTDFYNNCLNKEAAKYGVETMLLQCALTVKRIKTKQNKTKLSIKKIYSYFVKLYLSLSKFLLKYLFGFNFKNIKILGGGNAQKFGVINNQSYNLFEKSGVKKEKMSVVGYIDFDLANACQKALNQNTELRKKIAVKYNINTNKQNIAIFSTPFNLKDIKIFTDQEQLLYYEKIVKIIRQVFNNSIADILFKIHPAEDIALYKPLNKYGIKLYDKNTINQELIYFTDLYIAHHSTTNFIPITMGKEAVFLNFCKLKSIDCCAEYFSIKKFVSNEKEFANLLFKFKNRQLKKQYNADDAIITKESIKKITNWIG